MSVSTPGLRAGGLSDVGRQRDVNEDRLHIDVSRGVFIVVDGVGGQAAGGKAADIAVRMLRERLERQTGSLVDRVREAITIANNEIFHTATQRAEWNGMACVLTIAVVENRRAVIGHVGDTRLYFLRGDDATKITPDHSPVGEREDARELSEIEAMRHPRRNEVFRDVGSTIHALGDPDFMFVGEIDFPDDAAILLCSDGLTDLVPLAAIRQTVDAHCGRPDDVALALVRAANDAGGTDNVTVVYVEGSDFSAARDAGGAAVGGPAVTPVRPSGHFVWKLMAVLLVLGGVGGWTAWYTGWLERGAVQRALAPSESVIVVQPGESIMAAIARAQPGSSVVVEPGEYRERLTLKDNVRVISRVSRAAMLRLPGSATEQDAAVVVAGVAGAELAGFRIVGDAASPLGLGIIARDSRLRLVDIEVTGATVAAIDLGPGDGVELIGSDIHDNSGAALVVRSGATARISHNTLARNAASDLAASAIVIESGATPTVTQNVFHAADAQALAGIDAAMQQSLLRDNWFVGNRMAPADGRGASERGR